MNLQVRIIYYDINLNILAVFAYFFSYFAIVLRIDHDRDLSVLKMSNRDFTDLSPIIERSDMLINLNVILILFFIFPIAYQMAFWIEGLRIIVETLKKVNTFYNIL